MLQKAVLLCLGLGCSAMALAECSPQSLEQVNQTTRNALMQLQAVQEEGDDDFVDMVSAAAREQLRLYKEALVQGIDAHLSCSAADGDSDVIQQALLPLITLPATETTTGLYGHEPDLVVTRQPDAPDIVLIRSGFSIPCGDDNLLLAYQLRAGKWVRVLRWQSDDYQAISGALGDNYTYRLLPAPQGAAGPHKIVVASGTPWCTSRWSVFNLNLIQLATAAEGQRTLFHTQKNYIRITDDGTPALRLKTSPQEFEVRAEVGMLDTDTMTRKGIYRYRIAGENIARIQPAAMNGRDFVDEWLQIDDETASRWSLPGLATDVHQLLQERYGSYGAVRRCQGEAERYQVAMTLDARSASDTLAATPEQETFFIIQPIANGFMMESVATQASPECDGPDIMPKR